MCSKTSTVNDNPGLPPRLDTASSHAVGVAGYSLRTPAGEVTVGGMQPPRIPVATVRQRPIAFVEYSLSGALLTAARRPEANSFNS